jgi:Ca2+-dependent lipid-binding protein
VGNVAVQQTTTAKSADPVWGQQTFNFVAEAIFTPLTVEVWDHETKRDDILLSTVTLSPSELLRQAMKLPEVSQTMFAMQSIRQSFSFEITMPLKVFDSLSFFLEMSF